MARAITVTLLVVACGDDAMTPSSTFEPGDCAVELPAGLEAKSVRCGKLIVPEDRTQSDGAMLQLPVVVLLASGPDPAPDPLVVLTGGPGDPALVGGVPAWASAQRAPIRNRRDIVLFEARGTGTSTPSLDCPEFDEQLLTNYQTALTGEEETAALVGAARACHDRLVDEGINVGAYTSAAMAADAHDLMAELGYEAFNVRGISYGTRVALTLLREAPSGVRSVILDSSVPVQANLSAETPAIAEGALGTLFGGCAADEDCAAAFPDLENTFYDLAMALDDAPISVEPIHPETGEPFTLVVNGHRWISGIRQALYDTPSIPLLPILIDSTAGGDTTLLAAAAGSVAVQPGESLGAFFAVTCAEEAPFNTAEIHDAESQGVREDIRVAMDAIEYKLQADVCAFWGAPAPAPPASENEAVASDVPVLVLAGEYDPVTPPEYGQLAAETLSHSAFLTFPSVGHGVQFAETAEAADPRCALAISLEFLDDPNAELDTSCIGALPPPNFVAP